MKLTSENVDKVFGECLANPEDLDMQTTYGEGVRYRGIFNLTRLVCNRDKIDLMLNELPEQFHEKTGGGWTFLNACKTKSGELWGQHEDVDQLIMLGNAIGRVKFLMPREMWPVLPGGMPYFVISC